MVLFFYDSINGFAQQAFSICLRHNINKYKLIEFPTPQNNRYQFA